jgi:hypothetical protein
MNIWALDKDISIKHLLLLVDGAIPALTYQLDTNDGLDSKAVRLTSNDASVSVYIYTYGQDHERYGVHLEYPDVANRNTGTSPVDPLGEEYDNLSFAQLLSILQVQLSLE